MAFSMKMDALGVSVGVTWQIQSRCHYQYQFNASMFQW